MEGRGGFEHNLQSLRVVDELEVRYAHAPGLNLTWPVRQGIATHATLYDTPAVPPEFAGWAQPSLEAQTVDLADMIAYSTHDLDDALRIGLADEDDLAAKGIELWADAVRAAEALVSRSEAARTQVELSLEEARGERAAGFLPPGSRKRADVRVREAIRWMIGRLVEDVVTTSAGRIAASGVRSADEAMSHPERLVALSESLRRQLLQLAAYLRDVVYLHPDKLQMEQKARRVVRGLFEVFVEQPRLLPRVTQERLHRADVYRVVCDYIAGMTDRFALAVYTRLFETSSLGFGGGTRL
jgi:dGTPase